MEGGHFLVRNKKKEEYLVLRVFPNFFRNYDCVDSVFDIFFLNLQGNFNKGYFL